MENENKLKYQKTDNYQAENQTEDVNDKKLNFDCLVSVFQFLPIFDRIRCERVCKQWQEASQISWYSFKKLDLLEKTWGKKADNAETYIFLLKKVLSRCGEFLRHVDLSENSFELSKPPHNLSMLAMCPNLKELNLYGIKVGIGQLKFLAKRCKNIDTLCLSRLTRMCNDSFLEDHLFPQLKLRCLRLKSIEYILNGSCLRKLSPEYIEEIALISCFIFNMQFLTFSNFKKLHTFNISGTFCLRDPYRHYDVYLIRLETQLTTIFRELSELKNLKVLNISCSYVDDKIIQALTPLRNQLTTLDISYTAVSDVGLQAMTSSSSLEYLYIQCLKNITGEGLGNMPSLKTLNCSFCDLIEDEHLSKVLDNSKNLEKLNVSYCPKITKNLFSAAKNAQIQRENHVRLLITVASRDFSLLKEILSTGEHKCKDSSTSD